MGKRIWTGELGLSQDQMFMVGKLIMVEQVAVTWLSC